MNSFQKWLQDHLALIRLGLLLFVGLNLLSTHQMFSVSLLALAHIIVAVVLLLEAFLIH